MSQGSTHSYIYQNFSFQNLSNSSMMTLLNVSLASTGRYRCEVSTEAPMFSTESKYGDLLVVILPKKAPVIMGGEAEYSPGDFVHLNCSSFESKPAADLTWTINGKKVRFYEKPLRVRLESELSPFCCCCCRARLFITMN